MTTVKGLQSFLDSNLSKVNQKLQFPLVRGNSKKGHSEYTFQGINPRISLFASGTEADIWYLLNENHKDIIVDLSVGSKFTSGIGYFCDECKVPIFKTEDELYFSHFVADLQKIQRKYFKSNMYLLYKGSTSGGFFFTQIKTLAELKKLDSDTRTEYKRDQIVLIAIEKITF